MTLVVNCESIVAELHATAACGSMDVCLVTDRCCFIAVVLSLLFASILFAELLDCCLWLLRSTFKLALLAAGARDSFMRGTHWSNATGKPYTTCCHTLQHSHALLAATHTRVAGVVGGRGGRRQRCRLSRLQVHGSTH